VNESRYKSRRTLPETRRPNEPEIWGPSQVAAHLGVEPSNLTSLAGLPDPYQHLPAATVWRADDVRRYARMRKLKTDRVAA
jgi:hypothetical protein